MRLVTYTGFQDVNVRRVSDYVLLLKDAPVVSKLNILMAFPTTHMKSLKSHIKRRQPVADEKLQPITKIADRPKIKFHANPGDSVEVILRNGLVMTGDLAWINKYNIVLKLGDTIVLIFKHGVYSFEKVKP